jgi:hypothetical protein
MQSPSQPLLCVFANVFLLFLANHLDKVNVDESVVVGDADPRLVPRVTDVELDSWKGARRWLKTT